MNSLSNLAARTAVIACVVFNLVRPINATAETVVKHFSDGSTAAVTLPIAKISVSDACSLARTAFPKLIEIVHSSSEEAANAGFNAKGLGYFSGGKHYHVVEDDYKRVSSETSDGLDQVEHLRVAVDPMAEGSERQAIVSYADAIGKTLHASEIYARIALIYERSVNSRNIAYSQTFFAHTRAAQYPSLTNALSANNADYAEASTKMSAQDANQVLEDNHDIIRAIPRSLELPHLHFEQACGSDELPLPSPSPS